MVAGATAMVLDVPSGGTNLSAIPHKVAQEKSNPSEMMVQIIYSPVGYFFLSLKQGRDHYRKHYFRKVELAVWTKPLFFGSVLITVQECLCMEF